LNELNFKVQILHDQQHELGNHGGGESEEDERPEGATKHGLGLFHALQSVDTRVLEEFCTVFWTSIAMLQLTVGDFPPITRLLRVSAI
jgi:hypothetical protein